MSDRAGDHVRRALLVMRPADRRALLIAARNAVKDRRPDDPVGQILDAVQLDALLAEDEERALAEAVDAEAS